MPKLAGVELEGENLLTVFACFAVGTTRDEDNTERPYNTTECVFVAKKIIAKIKPDIVEQSCYKRMNITYLHEKWRDPSVDGSQEMDMRRDFEHKKDYYLDRVSKLLKPLQEKQKQQKQKQKQKKAEKKLEDRGYGEYQVPGYSVSTPRGHPPTHEYTFTFQSQKPASSNPHPDLQAPVVEPVSNALDELSINATSAPPTLQDSARGRTFSDSTDFLPTYDPESSTTPIMYPYERNLGASLRDPVLQPSNTNPIRSTNRQESRSQAPETNEGIEESLDFSTSPSRGSNPPPQRRRLGDTEGREGHKHAKTSRVKPIKKPKDASKSERKGKRDETADRDKKKDNKKGTKDTPADDDNKDKKEGTKDKPAGQDKKKDKKRPRSGK